METVIAVVSTVPAVATVLYAHYALVPSKAAVLTDWLSQYSDDDMGKAMGLLRSWQKRHGGVCRKVS